MRNSEEADVAESERGEWGEQGDESSGDWDDSGRDMGATGWSWAFIPSEVGAMERSEQRDVTTQVFTGTL